MRSQFQSHLSRRKFIGVSAAFLLAPRLRAADAEPTSAEPVIDIHQHTHYHGRSDEDLIRHQKTMGVALSVLLPAGSVVNRPSTHDGKSNGLAAECHGNESVLNLATAHPKEFLFFANEVADLPEAPAEIRRYLQRGARGIGEQKFGVDCDSADIERVRKWRRTSACRCCFISSTACTISTSNGSVKFSKNFPK